MQLRSARITKITTQKNNKERYNIFIDKGNGEEFGFSVDEGVMVTFRLKKGMVISEEQFSLISYEDDIKKAYNLSLNYLSYRMRASKEVRTYLKQKDFSKDIIHEVIEKLSRDNYINDQEFANAFVRTRKATSTKGPLFIQQELIRKEMSRSVIELSLKEFSYSEEIDKVISLINKWVEKYKKNSFEQTKQKLKQKLKQNGFSDEAIHEGFSIVSLNKRDDEEWEAVKHHGYKLVKRFRKKYVGWEYEQRIKQSLFAKGFSTSTIEKFFGELEEHLN